MAELNPSKENVRIIAKNPIAYMLGVAILLLGIFVTRSFNTDDASKNDCKEAIAIERNRADKATELVVQVLREQGQAERDKQKYRDSVLRATVGNKAKRIINNSK